MSRQAGSIVRGIQGRAGYPSKRAGSRCGYVLRTRRKVKVGGNWPGNLQANWQGREGSDLGHPVLETGTLPTELHPCGDQASPLISAVSSIGQGQIARAKRLTPCSTQLFSARLGHTPMISIRPTTRARGRET